MPAISISLKEKLWKMVMKLRGDVTVSEFKGDVLGVLFLRYVTYMFDERYSQHQNVNINPENKENYHEENYYWISKESRWSSIIEKSTNPEIGQVIDDVMQSIENENSILRGIFPINYARVELNEKALRGLLEAFSFPIQDKDSLLDLFEYFINQFAAEEGTSGGEFYTPKSVATLLADMIQPFEGKLYDPCCGAGGMFVQSDKLVHKLIDDQADLSIYGQEADPIAWKIAKMNAVMRGINAQLGEGPTNPFQQDIFESLKADYIMANVPFNSGDWGGDKLQKSADWEFGIPPERNANYAWIQHIISKLSSKGTASFVLANSSMSTNMTAEYVIRKKIIEQDLVECIVTLPSQLFYSTQMPVCLWLISKDKTSKTKRDRSGEILFIDARELGHMVASTIKEFTMEEISSVALTYNAWRGGNDQEYKDIAGFCKVATMEEVVENEYDLTSGRYVTAEEN